MVRRALKFCSDGQTVTRSRVAGRCTNRKDPRESRRLTAKDHADYGGVKVPMALISAEICTCEHAPAGIACGRSGSRRPRWSSRAGPVMNEEADPVMTFQYLVPASIGAVFVVLLLGLWNMLRGGSANLSQKLMRWRVGLQFVAIVVIMVAIYLKQNM